MKTYWSAIYSLLLLTFLAGCGKEQFGSAAQNSTSSANAIQNLNQLSCSSSTLIKPKVDILYVVDNSSSTKYLSDSIKNTIKYTIDTISKEFDYRVVGTTLLPIPGDSTPFDDFQFMTNSTDPYSGAISSKRVISSSEFSFFQSISSGGANEAGLSRTINFINANKGSTGSLFRQNAYNLIILISNGRDTEVERYPGYGDINQTVEYPGVFDSRTMSFINIKNSLQSQQFRFIAATTSTNCSVNGETGSLSSKKSYIKMANSLYDLSGATDSPGTRDSYDLCSHETAGLFNAVNNSIQQVVLNHKYKYWPITFTNDDFDTSKIQVYKTVGNNPPVQITTGWTYRLNPNFPSGFNTRTEPTVGEPTTARHLIEFSSGNEIEYPECVSITSTTKTEYFGYIVLPQAPKLSEGVTVRINGAVIPQSATNGWSYVGSMSTNIKMPFPNPGDEVPAVNKTGFMIQLNGTANYYKSGDNVQVTYVSAPI